MLSREVYIYRKYGCYVVKWTGQVAFENTVAHWRDLVARSDWSADLHALHDVRGRGVSPDFMSSPEDASQYSEELPEGSGKVAILVDSRETYQQGQELMDMMGVGDVTLVTYSEDEAKAWVGLPETTPLP